MRIPVWNQTKMRRGQWKSSTLVCFVVFIFANTRRVVCVIKISAIRLGLGLRRTRTTWLAKPFLSQERSNMHVDSLEHTHFCPLGDYFFYVYFLAGFEHGSLRIYFFHRSRFCPALIGANVDNIFSENRGRWWDLN